MFATLFTLIAVTICFASESTFALLYLGDQYVAAPTEMLRAQFLAAGEAVIAADMWHSSGASVSGILLQGGGVIISLVMLRSRDFSKVTAIAGLLGNALDLTQHLLHPFAPSVSATIQMLMGPFIWSGFRCWRVTCSDWQENELTPTPYHADSLLQHSVEKVQE